MESHNYRITEGLRLEGTSGQDISKEGTTKAGCSGTYPPLWPVSLGKLCWCASAQQISISYYLDKPFYISVFAHYILSPYWTSLKRNRLVAKSHPFRYLHIWMQSPWASSPLGWTAPALWASPHERSDPPFHHLDNPPLDTF